MTSVPTPALPPPAKAVTRGLWYILPAVVSAVVPLATLPLLTRALSPQDYGAWALSTAYGVLATGLANPGLLAGFERGFFAATDKAHRATLLYSVVTFAAACLLIVGIVTWWLRRPIAVHLLGSSEYGTLVVLGYAVSAVAAVKGYYLLFYRGLGDARSYALYSIDEIILGAVLSVVLVVTVGMGISGLAVGQLAAAMAVLTWVVLRAAAQIRPAFGLGPVIEAISVGYPLTPRVLVGTLSNQIDKYVIGMLQSVGGVGPYSIGQRLAYLPFSTSTALEHLYIPWVYSRMFEGGPDAPRDIGRYMTPFVYLTAAAACLVALFAEEAVALLTPPAYHQAAQVASVLTMGYAVMVFGKLPQLVYTKKTWVASVLSTVNLAINLVFCVIAVRLWGMTGAAWGFFGTCVVAGTIGFVVRQHVYPIDWETRPLIAVFALLVASSIVPLLLERVDLAYAWRFGFKVVMLVALAWLGSRLGVVTRHNARLLITTIAARTRRLGER